MRSTFAIFKGARILRSLQLFLGLSMLIAAFAADSADAQYLRVRNKFVTALVRPDNGLVTVVTTEGGYYGGEYRLSFDETSYLTVNIDGKAYTNNIISDFHKTKPNFGGYLTDATSRIVGDTVETIWKVPQGELYQYVYPVAFEFSGQIVYKWKLKNRSTGTLSVQAEYLLDTRIARNDRAKVLTRYGYRRTWSGYFAKPGPNYKPIPPFYQAFERDIQPPDFNPGLVSQGTFISEDLGLMRPDAVAIGQWTVFSFMLFEWPNPNQLNSSEEYEDSGVLMRFPTTGVFGGLTQEIGRTAYGTGQLETCLGEIYALIYRPRTIRANKTGDGYTPNPFDVEMYLFNTNPFTEAAFATAQLKVGPHLKIISPNPGGDSTILRQDVDPSVIGLGSVSTVKWTVQAETFCDPAGSWLEFFTRSSLGDSNFTSPCRLPVTVPCLDRDTLPPIAEPVVTSGFTKSIGFHDDRQRDKGIDSIRIGNYDKSKFTVVVDNFTKCTNRTITIRMTQLDSTIGGCIPIWAYDCAGNQSYEEVCFPRYPLFPDTVAPRIFLLTRTGSFDGSICNTKYDSLLAVDDTTYDKGLRSIELTPGVPPVNMTLSVSDVSPGTSRHGFALSVIDSMVDGCISVRVTDLADNFRDIQICYCTIADSNRPVNTVFRISPTEWSVFATDDRQYDRHLDTIEVFDKVNMELLVAGVPVPAITRAMTRGKESFGFNVRVIDTMKFASFCVRTKDLADSSSLDLTARWWSSDTCDFRDTVRDTWHPNLDITPSPMQSPTKMVVTVDDIHTIGSQIVGWDRGIDSIWFTNVKGFEVPRTIYGGCTLQPLSFEVSVSDTLALDSLATVCIHIVDCAGNRVDTCWYYPIRGDDKAPIITGTRQSRTTLDLVVTDDQNYDRGLRHIFLEDAINFDPVDIQVLGDRSVTVPLKVTSAGRSAKARLVAVDLVGSTQAPVDREAHTSKIDVAVWVQNLQFKNSTLAGNGEDVRIPVYFSRNLDTFQLAAKGITEYEFAFRLDGDPGFTYAGFETAGTASANFTVDDLPLASRITLHGISNDGKPLSDSTLPLIYVVIRVDVSEQARNANIIPVTPPEGSVIFNKDQPYLMTGQNAAAMLPPPYGSLSGGNIVSVGTCTPDISSDAKPSVVSLFPVVPNPFTAKSSLTFSVPEDGVVSLSLYNAIGEQVRVVVNEYLPAGTHKVTIDGQSLAAGSYIARLEANGKIVSRTIRVMR